MKYIFFGTPRFAEIVLDGLIHANEPPVAVVCNPDRPTGRKKTITPPPVKVLVVQDTSEIDILQPEKINDDAFIKRLKAFESDFFVVAAYAKILPKAILDIPRLGTLGVHPSLLPKYRGASPIQSAILGGETTTGTTIYLIDEKTDHGPILAQRKLIDSKSEIKNLKSEILSSNLSYLELEEALAKLSAELLIETMPKFSAGKITSQPQDESHATFTKKFTTQDGFIDEKELSSAEQGNKEKADTILKKINAFNPEPGAWTLQNDKRIKLLKAEIRDNRLILTETQKEGERAKSI